VDLPSSANDPPTLPSPPRSFDHATNEGKKSFTQTIFTPVERKRESERHFFPPSIKSIFVAMLPFARVIILVISQSMIEQPLKIMDNCFFFLCLLRAGSCACCAFCYERMPPLWGERKKG